MNVSVDLNYENRNSLKGLLAKHKKDAGSSFHWPTAKLEDHLSSSRKAVALDSQTQKPIAIILYRSYLDVIEVDYVYSDGDLVL